MFIANIFKFMATIVFQPFLRIWKKKTKTIVWLWCVRVWYWCVCVRLLCETQDFSLCLFLLRLYEWILFFAFKCSFFIPSLKKFFFSNCLRVVRLQSKLICCWIVGIYKIWNSVGFFCLFRSFAFGGNEINPTTHQFIEVRKYRQYLIISHTTRKPKWNFVFVFVALFHEPVSYGDWVANVLFFSRFYRWRLCILITSNFCYCCCCFFLFLIFLLTQFE